MSWYAHTPRQVIIYTRYGAVVWKLVESKSNIVCMVEDIVTYQHHLVHAQRMIPYHVKMCREQSSNELNEEAMHYDASYYLVHDIWIVRKQKVE